MVDTEPLNNRVTTREFYDALLKQNDRMDQMERRILDRIDEVKGCFDEENKDLRKEIKDTRDEIDSFKTVSKWIDAVISAVFLALMTALGLRD